jgi:phosphonate ABC transporter permease subunit PhnE
MYPPHWSYLDVVMGALVETVHIATLGTLATIAIAFPVAFLAARNTTFNTLTWTIGRLILVASRSVNTVVWALVFVAIFGPGPMAGIWAIAARSIGFLGKLTAEAIEEIDEGAVEAIEATGASRLQVLWFGILPQVLPVIYGTIVYRWDINIRESTVLGFVGAGGIGILLLRLHQPVRVARGFRHTVGDLRRGRGERVRLRHRAAAHYLTGPGAGRKASREGGHGAHRDWRVRARNEHLCAVKSDL